MFATALVIAAISMPQAPEQGSFAPAQEIPTRAIVPLRPNVLDVDDDGDADLVTGNGFLQLAPPLVEIQLNDGTGSMHPSASNLVSGGSAFSMPRQVVPHDFDGDGLPELVACYSDGLIEIFPNLGNATYGAAVPLVPAFVQIPATASSYTTLCSTTCDLDEDGRPELVLPYFELRLFNPRRSLGLVLLESDGYGGWNLDYSTAINGDLGAIVSGDWNGDGHDDLAGVDGTATLQIASGNGRGALRAEAPVFLNPSGTLAASLVRADFDGDGDPDLVVGYGGSPFLEHLENDGTGAWASSLWSLGPGAEISTRDLLARDFDGDGSCDLVQLEVGHAGHQGYVVWWPNVGGRPTPAERFPAGTVQAPTELSAPLLSEGDLDGNATPDVVLGAYRGPNSTVSSIAFYANLCTPPYRIRYVGTGNRGSNGRLPTLLPAGGPAVIGSQGFRIELVDGPSFARTTLFLGREAVAPTQQALELLLVPLHVSIVDLDAAGKFAWGIPIPNDPGLVGSWGYAQAWCGDLGAANGTGIAASRRLGVRVGERF